MFSNLLRRSGIVIGLIFGLGAGSAAMASFGGTSGDTGQDTGTPRDTDTDTDIDTDTDTDTEPEVTNSSWQAAAGLANDAGGCAARQSGAESAVLLLPLLALGRRRND